MIRKLKDQMFSLRGSIVRAGIFALAWAVLPFWLFLLIAIYLFFIPFSQIEWVIIPFLTLIAVMVLQATNFYAAVIFGAIFWYILLIKEFYVVDRRAAYETLTLALTYLLFGEFYKWVGNGFGSVAAFFAFFTAAVAAGLFSSFIKNFAEDPASNRLLRQVANFVAFFLIFELLLAGLFLPLSFVYQASVVFLLVALLMELLSKYLFNGTVSRPRLLAVSSTVFVLLVLTLGSARWGL